MPQSTALAVIESLTTKARRIRPQPQKDITGCSCGERGQQMVRRAVNRIIGEAGKRANLGHIHPHMLRHSCGYALANKGQDFRIIQDWLGHRDPKHTSRYTRVAARRIEGVWD